MQNQVKVKAFKSDKQLFNTALDNFGNVIVFIFHSDKNEKSKQFLTNFQSSVPIFGSYNNVSYYSLQESACPQTFSQFNIQVTPSVVFTQTDKKVLKKYESPQDIGQIFDQLSTQIEKYRQKYQADRRIWQPKIQSIIQSYPVLIFIIGTPQKPQCGFTRKLVQNLKAHNVQFTFIDCLQDQYLRYWLRQIRQWRTFPQVFINGKIIGGSDAVQQLIQKGEFTKIVPESSKTQDAQLKYNILVKQNENIAFTNNFAFQNKQTESFLNKQREKYGNVYVYNANLDSKLHQYIKNNVKAEYPFLVVKGEVQNA